MKKKQLLILLAALVIGGAIGCDIFFKKSVNITITETNKLENVAKKHRQNKDTERQQIAKQRQTCDKNTLKKRCKKEHKKDEKNTSTCPGRCVRERLLKLACSRGSLLARCPQIEKKRTN